MGRLRQKRESKIDTRGKEVLVRTGQHGRFRKYEQQRSSGWSNKYKVKVASVLIQREIP